MPGRFGSFWPIGSYRSPQIWWITSAAKPWLILTPEKLKFLLKKLQLGRFFSLWKTVPFQVTWVSIFGYFGGGGAIWYSCLPLIAAGSANRRPHDDGTPQLLDPKGWRLLWKNLWCDGRLSVVVDVEEMFFFGYIFVDSHSLLILFRCLVLRCCDKCPYLI